MRAADFAVGAAPVERARRGAASFQSMAGLAPDNRDYSRALVTPGIVKQVAKAYGDLPDFDPKAIPAFHAMREEVKRQYDHLTAPESKGGMGMQHNVTEHDPYGDPDKGGTAAFLNHIREGRIDTFSAASTGGHPVFTNDENDMFRAVHDVFGHAGTGRGVDRHGEEAAFQKHAAMFSPLARQALATETRGQNHAMIAAGGQFQDQKVGLLHPSMSMVRFTEAGNAHERAGALLQAQQFHAKQGL